MNFHLLLSQDQAVRKTTSDVILSELYSNPEAFVGKYDQIKLTILSCCCSPKPSFATISILILCITTLLELDIKVAKEKIVDLVELSHQITIEFLNTDEISPQFYPDLSPVASLLTNTITSPNDISFELIHAIASHAKTGFLPDASLMLIIEKHLVKIAEKIGAVKEAEIHIRYLLEPMESPNIDDVATFIRLTLLAITYTGYQPGIVRAIMDKSPELLELKERLPQNLNHMSEFLLSLASATSKEIPKLLELYRENDSFVVKKGVQSESERRDYSLMAKKNTIMERKQYLIHRATVYASEAGGIFNKRKWIKRNFALLDEAGVVMWSDDLYSNKGGNALHLSELTSIELLPEDKAEDGHKNLFKITYGKDASLFSFSTYQEATQWNNIFKQALNAFKS